MLKTFGNMNSVQTRNAIHYLKNYEMDSNEIADHISSYKGAPKVKTKTISNLKGYMTKMGL